MKVREIVRNSALILNRTDIISYLDGAQNTGVDTLESLNLLTNLCALVVDELSRTYLPLTKMEKVTFESGMFDYANFEEKVVSIIAVYDLNGKKVDFVSDALQVLANVGTCVVEYEYLPKTHGLDDDIGYSEKEISATVLSYGVVAEYCITQGLFDEAVMHHKRYVDAIAELCLPKNKMIKSRSWF